MSQPSSGFLETTGAPTREDVTQADRERAAVYLDEVELMPASMLAMVRIGHPVDHALSIHFARCRHAYTARPDAGDDVERELAARKAVNTIIANLIGPLIPDFADRMRVGNEATTRIMAAMREGVDREMVDRPDDDALLPHLPETVRSEKRCGLQRSAWLTGWFIPWSPRNDNENAEGPWSHWVALAHTILKADAAAIAALSRKERTEA